MKKVLAALVAAAFSLSIAGTAMAVPVQVSQQHSQYIQVDQHAKQTKKKKAVKKKTAKKKQTAKKASKKQAA